MLYTYLFFMQDACKSLLEVIDKQLQTFENKYTQMKTKHLKTKTVVEGTLIKGLHSRLIDNFAALLLHNTCLLRYGHYYARMRNNRFCYSSVQTQVRFGLVPSPCTSARIWLDSPACLQREKVKPCVEWRSTNTGWHIDVHHVKICPHM